MAPSSKPGIDFVIRDRATSTNLGNFSISGKTIHLFYDGKSKNINFDLMEIEKAVGHQVHPQVFDIYKVAFATYMADLLSPRPQKTGGRVLNILISVSDKSKWESQNSNLKGLLRTLTGDIFNFHFVQGTRPQSDFVFQHKSQKVVSLFSGGLDSLSGVKYLLDRNLAPILISHCSQNLICHVQTTLSALMDASLGKEIEFHQISARQVPGKQLGQMETSQKSRSFLFLSLASVFALELGIDEVYLFENGILAMNLPLVPSRSFNNTKTAHPDFLSKFNAFLKAIYACPTYVQNPFLYKTKGEVISLLNCQEFQNMVKETVSCSEVSRLRYRGVKTSQVRHCGSCVPCILRRFAVVAAQLQSHDSQYEVDILGDFNLLSPDAKTTIMQTLDFGYRVESHTDGEIFNDIPELYTETVDPEPIILMIRRYFVEVKNCLRNNATSTHRDKLPYLF